MFVFIKLFCLHSYSRPYYAGLRTAKADKAYSAGTSFLEFEVSGPSTVYLCWDRRCHFKPKYVVLHFIESVRRREG